MGLDLGFAFSVGFDLGVYVPFVLGGLGFELLILSMILILVLNLLLAWMLMLALIF